MNGVNLPKASLSPFPPISERSRYDTELNVVIILI